MSMRLVEPDRLPPTQTMQSRVGFPSWEAISVKRREKWLHGLTLSWREIARLRRGRVVARRDNDVLLDRRLRAILLAGHDRQ